MLSEIEQTIINKLKENRVPPPYQIIFGDGFYLHTFNKDCVCKPRIEHDEGNEVIVHNPFNTWMVDV